MSNSISDRIRNLCKLRANVVDIIPYEGVIGEPLTLRATICTDMPLFFEDKKTINEMIDPIRSEHIPIPVTFICLKALKNGCHPSHRTRVSDASSFDEVCKVCGAHDSLGSWGKLAERCPGKRNGC